MYLVLAAIGFLALVQGQTLPTTLMTSTKLPEVHVTKMEHLTSTEGHLMSGKPMEPCDQCSMAYEEGKKNEIKLEKLMKTVEEMRNCSIADIHENCILEITSVPMLPPGSSDVQKGSIMVNNEMAIECNNQVTGPEAKAGLTLCAVDPHLCKALDCRHFKTYDMEKKGEEGEYLRTYLENLPPYTTVVGTSCGDSVSGLGEDGTLILKKFNIQVDEVQKGDKYGFILQIKGVWLGLWEKSSTGTEPLKLKFLIEGLNTNSYHYKLEK